MLVVCAESYGEALQRVVPVKGEVLSARLHRLVKRIGLEHYLLADALQNFFCWVVQTAAHKISVCCRFKVNVISGHARFLSARAHIYAEPVFVRTLVGREAYVAVYAIGAVLWLKVLASWVEQGNALYKFFGKGGSLLLDNLVFGSMSIEPRLVVILRQLQVKIEYFFHIFVF